MAHHHTAHASRGARAGPEHTGVRAGAVASHPGPGTMAGTMAGTLLAQCVSGGRVRPWGVRAAEALVQFELRRLAREWSQTPVAPVRVWPAPQQRPRCGALALSPHSVSAHPDRSRHSAVSGPPRPVSSWVFVYNRGMHHHSITTRPVVAPPVHAPAGLGLVGVPRAQMGVACSHTQLPIPPPTGRPARCHAS